ncbi:hypothetical protein BH23GEM3_BH23GEM3_04010 [soil metagenome]|nr:OmpA family protein [Gemmatimonadota bacterium]
MIFQRHLAVVAVVLCTLFALPEGADAQVGKRLRERAKEKVEQRIEKRADQAMEKALDGTENAITCVVTDAACIEKAGREGRQVVVTDAGGNAVAGGASPAPAAGQRAGEGAWANFDFVTGDRALFAEDFSRDRVGNFPQRLELRGGNMEIVEWQGRRYLRSTAEGSFDVILPEVLPERFTVEFDLFDPSFWPTFVYGVDSQRKPEEHTRAFFAFNKESGLVTGNLTVNPAAGKSAAEIVPREKMMRVSIMADGRYMKVFLDENRISNLPSADFPRSNRIRFDLPSGTSAEKPLLIGNLRIAAGGTSLYDALQADGRVSTQGILFDTGSDRIRPESTPTLKEITGMLKEHGSLRLMIEGHTDNVGQAASNQALSEKRAAAVRAHLVGQGIDAARLQAAGKGQSEPAGSNDTPEGRQNNRRVVLVRQ